MGKVHVEILDDAQSVAERGRQVLLECVADAHQGGRTAYVALAGGSTPRSLYRLLAQDPGPVDWSLVHLFVSDDRVVPLADDRSNSGMVQRELLTNTTLMRSRWHPTPVHPGCTRDTVAAEYEEDIRRTLHAAAGEVPRFDVVMLGMGSDRHTASLFPGQPALDEEERLVVGSPPGTLPPPVDRVTFTLPLINAARTVLFCTAGADKQEAFAEVRGQLAEPPSPEHVPAARARPAGGVVTWLVDRDAAGT